MRAGISPGPRLYQKHPEIGDGIFRIYICKVAGCGRQYGHRAPGHLGNRHYTETSGPSGYRFTSTIFFQFFPGSSAHLYLIPGRGHAMRQLLFFVFVQSDHVILLQIIFVLKAPHEYRYFSSQGCSCPLFSRTEEALGRSEKRQGLYQEKADMDDGNIIRHAAASALGSLGRGPE